MIKFQSDTNFKYNICQSIRQDLFLSSLSPCGILWSMLIHIYYWSHFADIARFDIPGNRRCVAVHIPVLRFLRLDFPDPATCSRLLRMLLRGTDASTGTDTRVGTSRPEKRVLNIASPTTRTVRCNNLYFADRLRMLVLPIHVCSALAIYVLVSRRSET